MHEYIKKLAASLCLLENNIKDIEFKIEIKKLSMSLICLIGDKEQILNLRKVLIQVVDVLDILKIAGHVSVMNAEVVLEATVRIIEELDKEMLHTKSFILPKFSLSEMYQNILRDRVKEDLQNQYLNNLKNDGDVENEIFRFTKIPEQEITSNPSLYKEANKSKEVAEKNTALEKKKTKEKDLEKVEGKKDEESLVYTVFGDAEQQLIDERRVRIMSILKNGGGSLATISKLVPGLNLKTLQRDLTELMRERKVIMLGKKRWSKYYLK